MEKEIECAGCGVYFRTNDSRRRYCDKCKGNSNIARDTQRAVAASRARQAIETPATMTCKKCGQQYKTLSYRIFIKDISPEDRKLLGIRRSGFCSEKCRDDYRKENLKCKNCGVSLEKMDVDPDVWQTHFCSEECKLKYYAKNRKKLADTLTPRCEECKKMFVTEDPDEKYCSNECRQKAEQRAKEMAGKIVRIEHCPYCGKVTKAIYDIKKIPANIPCCCEDHQKKYAARLKKQEEAHQRKIDKYKRLYGKTGIR